MCKTGRVWDPLLAVGAVYHSALCRHQTFSYSEDSKKQALNAKFSADASWPALWTTTDSYFLESSFAPEKRRWKVKAAFSVESPAHKALCNSHTSSQWCPLCNLLPRRRSLLTLAGAFLLPLIIKVSFLQSDAIYFTYLAFRAV